mgnify:CR=1 FL=1
MIILDNKELVDFLGAERIIWINAHTKDNVLAQKYMGRIKAIEDYDALIAWKRVREEIALLDLEMIDSKNSKGLV